MYKIYCCNRVTILTLDFNRIADKNYIKKMKKIKGNIMVLTNVCLLRYFIAYYYFISYTYTAYVGSTINGKNILIIIYDL